MTGPMSHETWLAHEAFNVSPDRAAALFVGGDTGPWPEAPASCECWDSASMDFAPEPCGVCVAEGNVA